MHSFTEAAVFRKQVVFELSYKFRRSYISPESPPPRSIEEVAIQPQSFRMSRVTQRRRQYSELFVWEYPRKYTADLHHGLEDNSDYVNPGRNLGKTFLQGCAHIFPQTIRSHLRRARPRQ